MVNKLIFSKLPLKNMPLLRYCLLIILMFFVGQLAIFHIVSVRWLPKMDRYLLSLKYKDNPNDRFPAFFQNKPIELALDRSLSPKLSEWQTAPGPDHDNAALIWIRSSPGTLRYYITSIDSASAILLNIKKIRETKEKYQWDDDCKISGRNLLSNNLCFLSRSDCPSLPDYEPENQKQIRQKEIPVFFGTAKLLIAIHNTIENHDLVFTSLSRSSPVNWLNNQTDSELRYYITFSDSAYSLLKYHQNESLKITGKNLYAAGTVFITDKNSPDLPDRNFSLLQNYSFWLSQILKGNLGKAVISSSQRYDIKEYILAKGVINLLWTLFVLLIITLIALIFAYSLVFLKSRFVKFVISAFNEIFAAIPDFLIALFLIITFYSLMNKKNLEPLFFANFKFLLLPSLGLAFANGNIAGLSRLLQAKISAINENIYVNFLRVNGLKEKFVRYSIILKEILPDIIEYNAGKFALIFGALLIFEKLLTFPALGYTMENMISHYQAGFIVCFFFFINLLVILINLSAKISILILSPVLRRKK
jgi:peptide/nickel transport system permease protein